MDDWLFIPIFFSFFAASSLPPPYFFFPVKKSPFGIWTVFVCPCSLLQGFFGFTWRGKRELLEKFCDYLLFSPTALSNNTDSLFSWRSGLQVFICTSYPLYCNVEEGLDWMLEAINVLCHIIYNTG